MRRFLLTLLLLAPTLSHSADSDTKTLRVFIFAGQSNMVGTHSRVSGIKNFPPFSELDQPQKKVLFSYKLGREEMATSDGWIDMQPTGDYFGPELAFADQLTKNVKAPIAIIKCASGGTGLADDWNPDQPTGFKLYPLALEHVRTALAELDKKKKPYRIEGFMWHQGENDMFKKEFQTRYAENLKNFIASWRRDLKKPQLKFYVGELCTKTIWGMDNRENMHAIRTAQKSVAAADPLVEYIPTSHDAVEIGGDAGLHYHYGTLGQLQHGVNYADAYLRTIGVKKTSERPLRTWPYAKGSPVRLFILAGHRNMEGEIAFTQELTANKTYAPLASDNARIAFRYSIGGSFKTSHNWEPLGPAGPYDTFGPELSFAKSLQGKVTGSIAIAKFTHSGSQINDWTPAGTSAKDCNLYPAFIAFVKAAVADLKAKGHPVQIECIFYHAGENDMAYGAYRREAAKWIQATVAQSRIDLDQPKLPWYVSQQSPPEEEGLKAIDVTAELAAIAAADPAFHHLKALELAPHQQKLIINTEGILKLGEILAKGYLEKR
jgi:Carbohydrate esterase, sialic acid-specific acetylesterase